jgi:hypothetical protein
MNMRSKRGILWFTVYSAFLAFLCGCATKTPPQSLFSMSGPDWHVQQGQALWTPRTGAPQFGGDILLATNNGDAFVQFNKTPLTIVTAQTTLKNWLIRFPQNHQAWSGRQPAPARTIWLYLADALAGKPLPKPLHFELKPDGNWRLENVKTGEILEGFLSS